MCQRIQNNSQRALRAPKATQSLKIAVEMSQRMQNNSQNTSDGTILTKKWLPTCLKECEIAPQGHPRVQELSKIAPNLSQELQNDLRSSPKGSIISKNHKPI